MLHKQLSDLASYNDGAQFLPTTRQGLVMQLCVIPESVIRLVSLNDLGVSESTRRASLDQ